MLISLLFSACNCRGFRLCKYKPNSRDLEELSKLANCSPKALKTESFPLLKDLDLSVVCEIPGGVS